MTNFGKQTRFSNVTICGSNLCVINSFFLEVKIEPILIWSGKKWEFLVTVIQSNRPILYHLRSASIALFVWAEFRPHGKFLIFTYRSSKLRSNFYNTKSAGNDYNLDLLLFPAKDINLFAKFKACWLQFPL